MQATPKLAKYTIDKSTTVPKMSSTRMIPCIPGLTLPRQRGIGLYASHKLMDGSLLLVNTHVYGAAQVFDNDCRKLC